jgi:hypothetical protein
VKPLMHFLGEEVNSWGDMERISAQMLSRGWTTSMLQKIITPNLTELVGALGPIDSKAMAMMLTGSPSGTVPSTPRAKTVAYTGPTPTTETKKSTTVKEVVMNVWDTIDAVMGVSRRILLRGMPGTGKTYAATKRGLAQGQKVYSVTMTPETPAAEFRGHFVPKGGEMVWMDGPAIRAWREGARLVINEIDQASPDCLSLMFAVLDDPEFAEFSLPTGETVRPEQGFQVVATMNGEPEDLPVALQDRFPVSILIEEPNPEAIQSLPEDLRGPAASTALIDNPDRRVSIRAWAEFANLRHKLGKEVAAKAIFGPRYQEALDALAVNDVDL